MEERALTRPVNIVVTNVRTADIERAVHSAAVALIQGGVAFESAYAVDANGLRIESAYRP